MSLLTYKSYQKTYNNKPIITCTIVVQSLISFLPWFIVYKFLVQLPHWERASKHVLWSSKYINAGDSLDSANTVAEDQIISKVFHCCLGIFLNQELSFNLISTLLAHDMVFFQREMSCFRYKLWFTNYYLVSCILPYSSSQIKPHEYKTSFFSMMADQMRRAVEAPSAERYSRKRKLIFSINLFFI